MKQATESEATDYAELCSLFIKEKSAGFAWEFDHTNSEYTEIRDTGLCKPVRFLLELKSNLIRAALSRHS